MLKGFRLYCMDVFGSFFCLPHCLSFIYFLCLNPYSSLIYQEDSCTITWLSRNISSSLQSCLPAPIPSPPVPCTVPRQRCLGEVSFDSCRLSSGYIPLLGTDLIAKQPLQVAHLAVCYLPEWQDGLVIQTNWIMGLFPYLSDE